MKASKLVSAVTAAALALGSVGAIAQPRGEQPRQYQDDRRGPPNRADQPRRPDARDQNRYERREREQRQFREHRRDEYRRDDRYRGDARPGYRPGPPPHASRPGPPPHSNAGGRGAGPRHDIYRGARLPTYYRTPHYVVQDWRYHRLPAPPRGHYWVQVGADYLLVAIATGIIVQLMLGY